jgi:hypothetical protein
MEICNYPPALANSGRFREGRGKHHAASPWSAGTGTGSWGNEEDGESGGGREMRQNTINPVEISHSSWPFANDNYVNEEFTANKATNGIKL